VGKRWADWLKELWRRCEGNSEGSERARIEIDGNELRQDEKEAYLGSFEHLPSIIDN
jgi:hypothetical protein